MPSLSCLGACPIPCSTAPGPLRVACMLHASTLHHLYLESGKVTLVLCGISTRTLWNPRCAARALLGGRRCGHLALPFPRTLWLRLLLHSQSSVLVTLRLGRCPVPDSSAFMAVRPQQRFQRSATSHRPLKLCNYLLTRARETRDGGESHLLCSRICSALRILRNRDRLEPPPGAKKRPRTPILLFESHNGRFGAN